MQSPFALSFLFVYLPQAIPSFTVIGLTVGLFLKLTGTRAVSIVLFGLSRHDPATLAITASLLVAVASVAASVPAIRATRVDPANSLRSE